MQLSGNNPYQDWADVVVKMWKGSILKYDVWDEGMLFDSFVNFVMRQAQGDVQKIDFTFRQYGIYQDMGVGRDTPRGNPGDLAYLRTSDRINPRKPRPWYSSVFFREVQKLAEFQAYHYGKTALWTLKETIGEEAFDKRYKNKTKTVGSLKSQMYRDKQSERNFRNYRRRRFGENWKEYMREHGLGNV